MNINNLFFTADTHFGHSNLRTKLRTQFQGDAEMDEEIINNWNNETNSKSLIFHLGDFSFSNRKRTLNILKKLNGKICLIRGNHDFKLSSELLESFEFVKDYYELRIRNNKEYYHIILSHYPFLEWNHSHFGSWSLHGHCHGKIKHHENTFSYDVGVDGNNMKLLSFNNIKKIMSKKCIIIKENLI